MLAALSTGCRRQPSPPAEAADSRPTPQQSFQEIAQNVKDGIELRGTGAASGFVAQETGARSQFAVLNTVTSKFIPPANPTDPYRGTITVTSTSVYTLRRSAEDADSKEDDENAAEQKDGFSLLDESDDADSGFEVMDSDLVSASPDSAKTPKGVGATVQRQPFEDVRTYDLAYEDGRWVLKTKLDPETEKYIEKAFERALGLQP